MAAVTMDEPLKAFDEQTWQDVVSAMDRAYSELVDYQELLERQNSELDEMRQFMASVLASVSDLLFVVDKSLLIERTGGAIQEILGLASDPPEGSSLADLLDCLAPSFSTIDLRFL